MSKLDPIKQREFAVEVVRRLREQGFEAYWAGGCVRDYLLSREPHDYDVATSARPEQIEQVFSHRKTLALGAAFGVMTVLGPRGAGQIEVATFRHDVSYSDGRHPDRVEFSSPEEDAKRRDFSINGMFYDPLAEKVIDFVGGEADLKLGVVRAIGSARERFAEDKLRMLRAVRFAAVFDFQLEARTLAAMTEMATEVTVVSAERIADEMRKMLVLPGRAKAVEVLQSTGLLAAILPEAAEFASTPAWWARTAPALKVIGDASFPLVMAVLLESAYEQDTAAVTTVGSRWRLSKLEIERMDWLLENRNALHNASKNKWSVLQPLLSHEGAQELVAFHACRSDIEEHDLEFCRKQLMRPAKDLDPPPLVTGNDLINLGISPGPVFAGLLREARRAQLDGEVATREAALELVRKQWQNQPPH